MLATRIILMSQLTYIAERADAEIQLEMLTKNDDQCMRYAGTITFVFPVRSDHAVR